MGVKVTTTDWGVPGRGAPDKRHPHLPFWYDLQFENAHSPMETWMRLGMAILFPLARLPDTASDWRSEAESTTSFIGRRMGLKEELNFKVMPQGEHGLRVAFSSLAAFSRYNSGLSRLHRPHTPEASNDDADNVMQASLALLPRGRLPQADTVFRPEPVATPTRFEVKNPKAANSLHFAPRPRRRDWQPKLVSQP